MSWVVHRSVKKAIKGTTNGPLEGVIRPGPERPIATIYTALYRYIHHYVVVTSRKYSPHHTIKYAGCDKRKTFHHNPETRIISSRLQEGGELSRCALGVLAEEHRPVVARHHTLQDRRARQVVERV